ncbi:MAG: hypothetical protein WDO73_25270 [Ignavibacteriota bacterium]
MQSAQKPARASKRQVDYLRSLFEDMGIRHSAIQNWLNDRTRGLVSFLGDLTPGEASVLIEEMKIRKRDKNPHPSQFAVVGPLQSTSPFPASRFFRGDQESR